MSAEEFLSFSKNPDGYLEESWIISRILNKLQDCPEILTSCWSFPRMGSPATLQSNPERSRMILWNALKWLWGSLKNPEKSRKSWKILKNPAGNDTVGEVWNYAMGCSVAMPWRRKPHIRNLHPVARVAKECLRIFKNSWKNLKKSWKEIVNNSNNSNNHNNNNNKSLSYCEIKENADWNGVDLATSPFE